MAIHISYANKRGAPPGVPISLGNVGRRSLLIARYQVYQISSGTIAAAVAIFSVWRVYGLITNCCSSVSRMYRR